MCACVRFSSISSPPSLINEVGMLRKGTKLSLAPATTGSQRCDRNVTCHGTCPTSTGDNTGRIKKYCRECGKVAANFVNMARKSAFSTPPGSPLSPSSSFGGTDRRSASSKGSISGAVGVRSFTSTPLASPKSPLSPVGAGRRSSQKGSTSEAEAGSEGARQKDSRSGSFGEKGSGGERAQDSFKRP